MITARRLRRNFKRFLIPFETALLWVAGPTALGLYWLWHGALHSARLAGAFLTLFRF
jgi:hypothetical protein